METPIYYQDVAKCVDDILTKVGKRVNLGVPLGLGKPNYLVNALYQRAKDDPGIHLKIMTALSLEKPKGSSELERRFLEPFVARIFGNYPDLDYLLALRRNQLPANIELVEFYFKPGAFLNSPLQQQNYISCNYTDVAKVFIESGVNVITQMVGKKIIEDKTYYSLSSNTDVTLDLLPLMQEQRRKGKQILFIGQTNGKMPFMYRDAMLKPSAFDIILDNPVYDFTLFSVPNLSVNSTDYMIGLNASTLIKDGGTLQIGIGSLGDSIAYACQLRHKHNGVYKALLSDLEIFSKSSTIIEKTGETEKFREGLYGSSEMFVNGFWHLYKEGILKRRVYDCIVLQRLLNEGRITEEITSRTLEVLLEEGAISAKLTRNDFDFLQRYGIFNEQLGYEEGYIRVSETIRIPVDLTANLGQLVKHCLGVRLDNGIVLHGGFFLGPQSLYDSLRNLSERENKNFCMTGISHVNQLYGNTELKTLQRKHARFMNTTIMVTLCGGAVSDGLENGQVISGVGGQYNFVAMAHALPDARSILMLRSTRRRGTVISSNIVWNYGHITIPRHLRDIVVTEYGIADLRGKSDKDVIAALLSIADSRFQEKLLEQAKRARKIPEDYQIPLQFRNNLPQQFSTVLAAYQKSGFFPDFPFGADFTHEEIVLGKVLKSLKATMATTGSLMKSFFKIVNSQPIPEAAKPYLARLQLIEPTAWKDQLIQKMIVAELLAAGHIAAEADAQEP